VHCHQVQTGCLAAYVPTRSHTCTSLDQTDLHKLQCFQCQLSKHVGVAAKQHMPEVVYLRMRNAAHSKGCQQGLAMASIQHLQTSGNMRPSLGLVVALPWGCKALVLDGRVAQKKIAALRRKLHTVHKVTAWSTQRPRHIHAGRVKAAPQTVTHLPRPRYNICQLLIIYNPAQQRSTLDML
jgi:hypothetical protein